MQVAPIDSDLVGLVESEETTVIYLPRILPGSDPLTFIKYLLWSTFRFCVNTYIHMSDEESEYNDGDLEYSEDQALLKEQQNYEEEDDPVDNYVESGAEDGEEDDEYDENGLLIARSAAYNEAFANMNAGNYYEGGETETNAGTEMGGDVDDMESRYDADEDDTRNYIDEYEVAPADEPLSTDKKLERLGLNTDKTDTTSGGNGGGSGGDSSESSSDSDSNSNSDAAVEMLYYNPHLMSDVLLSDTESRVLK